MIFLTRSPTKIKKTKSNKIKNKREEKGKGENPKKWEMGG
jgi:hypothetical protein